MTTRSFMGSSVVSIVRSILANGGQRRRETLPEGIPRKQPSEDGNPWQQECDHEHGFQCDLSIDPGVRGFEFNVPAASGVYTRLTLRDPQHTYEFESSGGGGPGEVEWCGRLREVVLEPCAQDAGPVLGADAPGEGGGGCRAAALGRQGANLADEPAAAPARHLGVTHEDIWALALHRLERLGGRGHSRRGRSVVFEHRDHGGADVLTVVNHEDPYTTQEQPVMRRAAEHRR